MSIKSENREVVNYPLEDMDWNELYKNDYEEQIYFDGLGNKVIYPNPELKQVYDSIKLIDVILEFPNLEPYRLVNNFTNKGTSYRLVLEYKEAIDVLKNWLDPALVNESKKAMYDSIHTDYVIRAMKDTGLDASFLHSTMSTPNTQILLCDGKVVIPAEMINLMISNLRKLIREPEFRKIIKNRTENAKNQFSSVTELIKCLYENYSRLVVCRIDFALKPEFVETQTLEEMQKYLRTLLNNRRFNGLFKDMVGYIWKLEHGIKKGLHYHCVFIFDGSNVQADGFYAQMIGTYWRDQITKGKGTFYNCNFNKNRYRNVGIGVIDHHDDKKVGYLHDALLYLCKTSQFIMLDVPNHIRCFGRSLCSGSRKNQRNIKRGRPRTKASSPLL